MFSGALDVVVIRHPDGSLHSSPFHVKFGKFKLLQRQHVTVFMRVNGQPIGLRMRLNSNGYGYFPPNTSKSEDIQPSLSLQKPTEEAKTTKARGWWPFRKAATVATPAPQDPLEEDETEEIEELEEPGAEEATAEVLTAEGLMPLEPVADESTTLTSDQLLRMQLRAGANTVTFSIRSRFRGEVTLNMKAYLWESTDKIVISDVDGTITRSDLLGHLMPIVGKDWSHKGVVKLLDSIITNGYKVVYLTARAIGQVARTKTYLEGLSQDDLKLPEGPIITSPDGIFKSLSREVIQRQPHKFKIKVLQQIASLFPAHASPFYSGFGNRDTDAMAYHAAGVQRERIFIINAKGAVLTLDDRRHWTSYAEITSLVEHMFPHLRYSVMLNG
jgi:phosphatidate phosphatase PAH1